MGKALASTASKATGNFIAKRAMSRATGYDFAPAVTVKEWGIKMLPSKSSGSSDPAKPKK